MCVRVCACVCETWLYRNREKRQQESHSMLAALGALLPALSARRPGGLPAPRGSPTCLDQERPPRWKTARGGHFPCAFHGQLCDEQPVPTVTATTRPDSTSRQRTREGAAQPQGAHVSGRPATADRTLVQPATQPGGGRQGCGAAPSPPRLARASWTLRVHILWEDSQKKALKEKTF